MSLSSETLAQLLQSEFGFTPVMAAELECYVYLIDESQAAMDNFWEPLQQHFIEEKIEIIRIEKERGAHQFELVTGMTSPSALAAALGSMRKSVEVAAQKAGVAFSFAAKPHAEQPSSGMHIHLHLADAHGVNLYHKTDEWVSETLRYSLGGLLDRLPLHLPIFFPTPNDYARLEDADHVPKIYGWGVNNRYCALRIPADPDLYNKRIEHRVPCANADPEQVVVAILEGVLHGLRERIEPPEQVYGKTSEWQIAALLKSLPFIA